MSGSPLGAMMWANDETRISTDQNVSLLHDSAVYLAELDLAHWVIIRDPNDSYEYWERMSSGEWVAVLYLRAGVYTFPKRSLEILQMDESKERFNTRCGHVRNRI